MLEELTDTIAGVATAVAPSVVRVHGGNHRGGPRTAGVIIDRDRVLTNAHGLPREGEVLVRFEDGDSTTATVRAWDVDGDLAVLELDTADRPAIPWAEGDVTLGTPVFAVAPSRHGARVTFGTVSGTGRRFRGPGGRPIEDGVEHTAPLARGSSGSPIVDAEGRLLGINTHRVEPFYLAQPTSERLRGHVDRLRDGETPVRRRLGIAVAPPHVAARLRAAVGLEPRSGVLVRDVEEGSPAAAAGIEPGDLLTRAGERELVSPDDLFAVLRDAPTPLLLTVVRGESEREVTVTFE